MSHYCQASIVTCEDFRLHQRVDGRNYIVDFIKNLKVDADLITRGGGIQDLVRPQEPGFDESVLRDLAVSIKLHHVKNIYLINHADCGAYGSFNFTSAAEEKARHYEDLRQAKMIILDKFGDLEIKLYYAELKEGTGDEFEIKELVSD